MSHKILIVRMFHELYSVFNIRNGWLCLFIVFTTYVNGQTREYSFNSPGNTCYLNYLVHSPSGDLSNAERPFIFILGKEGTDAKQAFDNDTLKNYSQFHDYNLVYLPNRGGSASNKLYCFEGLVSLLTHGFSAGHHNLFLAIKDDGISNIDLVNSEVDKVFGNVQLYPKEKNTPTIAAVSITEQFKETFVVEDISTQDEHGSYYIEPQKVKKSDKELTVVTKGEVKKYFGEPAAFNFTLTGKVSDISNGESLPFATVMVAGSGVGATTNEDGYFTILKVPSDTVTIVVQYVGYEKTKVYLTPTKPKKNLRIEMRPSSATLKGITVLGEKKHDVELVNKLEVSTVKMTPKKLAQLPSMGEKDVMRSFQLMPGVSASNESSSGLYVRGGTPDQNLVMFDGFTVYHVDHLYGFFSAFNSNALKDVQLYKGGFESKFGGRLSSVTELTGKDGNQKKFNLGADISLLSMNFYAEVPIGEKFSSIIAFRRSYKGFLYNKIFDQFNGEDANEQPQNGGRGGRQTEETEVTSYFYDLNGKFTYKPNEKDILSLSIFSGSDKLDNSSAITAPSFGQANSNFSNTSTDLTKYGNFGSSLKWSRKWGDKLYGNTILSYSNYYSDRDRSQERTVTDTSEITTTTQNGIFENNDLKDYSFKSDYKWDVFNKSQVQFGGFGTFYDIKYSYAQSDTTTVLDKDNEAILAGGYVQLKSQLLKDILFITPGIRASYYQTTDEFYYEPRASLSYKVTSQITLKGATGKYYQFANRVTREDILSGSKDFWLLSDGESVPVSSAIHYIAGISYDRGDYLFSMEGYYKDIQNLTEYSLRFNPSPVGVSYQENFFTGKGYARGIEFLAQKKSGALNGWVSYSIGEAKNQFDVYSDVYYSASQDVTHEFKAVGMYKYKRWDFSATWIFATGRPYTAPSGAYEVTLLDETTETYFTVTEKNSLRLPNYHRMDISANYKLLAGRKVDRRRREIGYIGFSIFNFYNRTNVWYKQYTIEDSAILETNVNYLGFTPNVTLSLKIR